MASLSVQDSDGRWLAQIEAAVPPRVASGDHFVSVTAELGWGEAVQCFVYRGPIDAGASVSAILSRLSTTVRFQVVRVVSLGNAGLDPLLHLRAEYRSVEEEGGRMGELKIAVMPRAEYPLLCWHDGIGNIASFARVVTDFARSFRFESAQVPPRRGELWYLSEGAALLGFIRYSEHPLDDGNMRTVRYSSSLAANEEGMLTTEDQAEVMTWGERGSLVEGAFTRLENGRKSLEVRLEQGASGWSYSGQVRGRAIRGSFVASEPILGRLALEQRISELMQQRQRRELESGARETAFTQLEYWPLLDPTRPTVVGYVAVPSDDGVTLRVDQGLLARATPSGEQVRHAVGVSRFTADASGRLREVSVSTPDGAVVASPMVRLPVL